MGMGGRAILSAMAYTACRAETLAKLRLQDFQHDGEQYVLRFHKKGRKSREIPVRLELQRNILADLERLASGRRLRIDRCFGRRCVRRSNLPATHLPARRFVNSGSCTERRGVAVAVVAAQFPGDGDY